MSAKTAIEWTTSTWNPVSGCTKVSAGCDNCYAETFAERWRDTPGHYFERGFDLQLRPDKLDLPLRWRKPRRIFVNSISDLFHEQVPDEYIAEVFEVMDAAVQHTFQVLTKRHARMRSLLHRWAKDDSQRWPLPNVWLGVSVEDQRWADIRVPALLDTPAAVRFLSCEPLLGPVDLDRILDGRTAGTGVPSTSSVLTEMCRRCGGWGVDCGYGGFHKQRRPGGIDWVITGGESGPSARSMHPDWARDLRDQCRTAGVPFFMKQTGSVLAREWGLAGKGDRPDEWPTDFPHEQEFPRNGQ